MDTNIEDVLTPRGAKARLHVREGTTDLSTVGSLFYLWGKTDDEYGFGSEAPRTFLDIGGHIGLATISVLLDNPECRAVVLEPLPENIELLERNLNENGVRHRAFIVHGAIGTGSEQRIGYRLPRVVDADPVHEYVGGPVDDDYEGRSITAPVYPLGDLFDILGDEVDLAKIDCEGCEYVALRSPDITRARKWVGEYHGPAPELPGFDVDIRPHQSGGTGMFTAVRL